MSDRYIAAIEIGSSKIRGGVGLADAAGHLDVVAVEEEKLTGRVRYGCIQNVDVSNTIFRICERLEGYPRVEPRKIKGIYVSLGGRSMVSELVDVSTQFSSEMEITGQIIEELKEKAAKQVPDGYDVAEVVPVKFSVDNKSVSNPVGSYGTNVSASMLVIVCATSVKRMIRRVVNERLGYEICGYVTRPTAEAALVLSEEEKRLGCMLVDFGAETTTVAIYKDGAPVYVATLPMGSRNISLDLVALNHTEERAEEIKKVSGNAMPLEGQRRQGADGIDYTEVNNYIHARAAEIVSNILAQIEYAGLKPQSLPKGIVIVGAGGRLRGFSELLEQHSKLRVRQGSPSNMVRISDGAIHAAENTDIIAVLAGAAQMPPKECFEQPASAESENDAPGNRGDYDEMYGDGDSEPTKGRDNGKDDDFTPEQTPKRISIFQRMRDRLAGAFGGEGETFDDDNE